MIHVLNHPYTLENSPPGVQHLGLVSAILFTKKNNVEGAPTNITYKQTNTK